MTWKQTWKIRRIPSSVPMGQDFPSSGRRFPPTCIWSPASARPLRPPNPLPPPRRGSLDDRELEAIMEREFGPIRRPVYQPSSPPPAVPSPEPGPPRKEYLIVDGYNILFAWEELAHLAREDLEMARNRLMDILSNYCGYKNREVILVFDGYPGQGRLGANGGSGIPNL
ncbi:MAG: NYN domain-containing protein [Oscillospiraceae bacterium]